MSSFKKIAACVCSSASYFNACGNEWVCNNCHARKPRRTNNPTTLYTASQIAIFRQLGKAGWKITKLEKIGRKVWIQAEKKNARHFIYEASIFGTIGVRGNLELSYCRFCADCKITEAYQLRSRLAD